MSRSIYFIAFFNKEKEMLSRNSGYINQLQGLYRCVSFAGAGLGVLDETIACMIPTPTKAAVNMTIQS
jgi:hypothetical protein